MIFMEQRELQQKIVTYQLLQKHLEELKNQGLLLEKKAIDLEATRQAIDDLKKTKKDSETLIPLGNESYTYGKIIDLKKLLVDIGSGVFVKKDIESSLKLLGKKRQDIEKMSRELHIELNNTANNMNAIALEIEKTSKQGE